MAVKDKSKAVMINNNILNNREGITLYSKKIS